jgi:hypothetical protein
MAIPLLEALLSKINDKSDPRIRLQKIIQQKSAKRKEKITIKNKVTEEKEDSIEVIANEVIEVTEDTEIKDAAAILADRIKKLYAGEIAAQTYNQANISNYNPGSAYNGNNVMPNSKAYNARSYDDAKTSSSEADNNGAERLKDENSTAYRLSAGSKYQAFIMTDPKGRLHSRWQVERIVNESADGVITQNNGLHYQGLS